MYSNHPNNISPSISALSIIEYSPKVLENTITYRPSLSLLAVIKGEYHYYFQDKTIIVKPGNVLFLPKTSAYKYIITSKDTYTMQITFDLYPEELLNLLPKCPTILDQHISNQIVLSFPKLINYFRNGNGYSTIMISSILFDFLANMIKETATPPYSLQLMPAIKYLEKNRNDNFPITYLADLCHISSSQLRRLFIKETGVSPLDYKNQLRMNEAFKLLKYSDLNITEISNVLQFDTLYAFSKFFRKQTGISPQNWRNMQKSAPPV